VFERLQIFLGCSWYVIAIGGCIVMTRFPALVHPLAAYWVAALLGIPVAMAAIHKLKLSKK
jgi:hypothetical protein